VNEEIGNGSTFKFQAMLIDLFNKLRFLMQGKIPRNSGMMLFCEMGRGRDSTQAWPAALAPD
jgi:hypothetical protein